MKKLTLYCLIYVFIALFSLLISVSISLFIFTDWLFFLIHFFLILFFLFTILFIILLVYIVPKKKNKLIQYSPVHNTHLTVVLTAYNDELSIGQSVKDFLSHPFVKRVIVISNNSKDNTLIEAQKAGAITYNETKQGYGACVHRALSEGIKYKDTELTLLCEGDMTFRAYDIDKFLSYIPHADIVNGTRIVEQLRNKETQLSNFMYYGNFFVGKLLELKHISKGTFTDVGTTYKLCRNNVLEILLPILDNNINLEFNPYFLDTALNKNIVIVECPITFHKRLGVSKGGNVNNWVAFKLGMRMIKGILFKW